ncbi:hypothetical protein, conserved [Trypanosoma brucei gambiense DAL972]|uniref:Regulator of chromosome condensation n=1 Tax=Trypanosoma brucei gambiense (strain MHOM/CI/86/DAL972) TaxID=679716 RepID=C9ZMQ7_TRYB9|nr:hypothetical protein, conserved [Trypanosoma brucei gambiense DAL972]CBH10560.1 hypothetical protein, conserved [Trypanosoma brucei gambiense DAL972]|eukprot:XP_011772849.1 hypothetical protein, conserved [Trypanosoma brucei gambiense DAL972]
MIRDAEFWIEARRLSNRGNSIFTTLLPLLHSRQLALDSGVQVNEINPACKEVPLTENLQRKEPYEENKTLQLPSATAPRGSVSESTLRVLQQAMMFAVPMYALRYQVTGMSMSSKTSAVVDRETKQVATFGAGDGVHIPNNIRCRGCAAGDNFFAVLTDQQEVWASGGLHVLTCDEGTLTASPLGKSNEMKKVASKALMVVGNGQRLSCLTESLSVQPLSVVLNPVTSIFPFRRIRFMDMGYGDDCYMVGMDSVLYKTVVSSRTLGTPRRIMTLSRTTVSRVASGSGFYVFIDENGQLYTIGCNNKGQLGNGQKQHARRRPFLHQSLRHHYFVMAAAGSGHSLALTSSGMVYGAGNNESGQLGLGEHVTEVLTFTPIPLPAKCTGIAAGPKGSMFACANGCVYTCGANDLRQLGLDVDDPVVYRPMPMPAVTSGVEAYYMDFGAYRSPPVAVLRSFCSSIPSLDVSDLDKPEVLPKPVSSTVSVVSEEVPDTPQLPSPLLPEDGVENLPEPSVNHHPSKRRERKEIKEEREKQSCGKCCVVL